jgi:preprotein translocase subunit YajC
MLLILPLVALFGLIIFYSIEEEWCIIEECYSRGYIAGSLISIWIVFYGIPVGIYFLIRSRKKKAETTKTDIQ